MVSIDRKKKRVDNNEQFIKATFLANAQHLSPCHPSVLIMLLSGRYRLLHKQGGPSTRHNKPCRIDRDALVRFVSCGESLFTQNAEHAANETTMAIFIIRSNSS